MSHPGGTATAYRLPPLAADDASITPAETPLAD